jgi:two-component system chemotaxis response regulator CheB
MSDSSAPSANGVSEPAAPIRVLLVDDSPVACALLLHLIDGDPLLQAVGVAADGEEGVAAAARLRPDVVVMDIHMPRRDGFSAARQIMENCPTRIVMVTASTHAKDVASTFQALEAGALAVLAKPTGPGDPAFEAAAAELLQTVRLMAAVPVVRRWPRSRRPAVPAAVAPTARVGVVAFGASTGGPIVLQEILTRLPQDLPVPLLIVQHISVGFAEGFAEWLAKSSGHAVRVAVHGEPALPGVAYVAPNGAQMRLLANQYIDLADAPAEHGLKPSVSYLFRSLAETFGSTAIAVLLTGMGRDGAQELKSMREAGAVTIAQDSATSIVFGMPGEAVKLGAAIYVLPPDAIAATVTRLVQRDRLSSPASATAKLRENLP